jgi:dolichol-phosphate mannosyltransferase
MNQRLIIVLPTYNEVANIAGIIHGLIETVPEADILVVDDSSPDGTAEVVKDIQGKFSRVSLYSRAGKEGLGKAYIDAFQKVLAMGLYDWALMMDADFSHDPKYIPLMLSVRDQFDCVIGSRYCRGGSTVGWEWWRQVLSKFGNLYCKAVTGLPINDCTGGFNLIRASFLQKLDFSKIDNSGYAFIMELKYSLFKVGARFTEIPIVFSNRRGGESKLSNHIIGEGILAPWKMIWRNK